MISVIYNPVDEYESKFKNLHLENTKKFFDSLVKESGVSIEENKKTVEEYNLYRENTKNLRKKYNWLRFFRVLMIISVLLIPVVILKITPKIRLLRDEIDKADATADELLNRAYQQMKPLNELFCDRDSLTLIEETVPLLSFKPNFTIEQEEDMKVNYDFMKDPDPNESTLDSLAGEYNENPFLFENKLIHTMGTETYHGYKTISWTETYRDSSGKMQRRTRSQTLHATVEKPKPFYNEQVVLNYGSQGAPELSFSRRATQLDGKSEKAIERHIKRGEKALKKKTVRAISDNSDFMSMSNTDFEVLFNALDRTDEVQFRTLFTPLAQTNMVDLILSKDGYEDDFCFVKTGRMNRIVSDHSQGRDMILKKDNFLSYSYDIIRENFINYNMDFFRAVYFDFAPVLSIPAYTERPVHSLKPITEYSSLYAKKECEALVNSMTTDNVVHPDTKTRAILKTAFGDIKGSIQHISVSAYSYDKESRADVVPVLGGDGRWHNVTVPWDEYIPLEKQTAFCITDYNDTNKSHIIASRRGLCILNNKGE